MNLVICGATILSGVAAIWFLYDKRVITLGWIKLLTPEPISPLSLPDDDYEFIDRNASFFKEGKYLPKNEKETEHCRSLSNHGVLKQHGKKAFKLTRMGRRMLVKNSV